MARGISYLVVGILAGAALTGISHGVVQVATANGASGVPLFTEVFNKVRTNYAEKPDDDKLVRGAIDGMLASLDPHSTYFDPKALQDFQTSMKGEEFGGLGLEVMMDDGLVKVVSPIDDTPAARAGLLTGDMITRIDDTPVKGLTLKEAVDRMRGPAKSSVRLLVQRGSGKDAREFTIVREIIHVQSVRSHLEGGDIGYIRITQFNQEAYDGVRKAFDHFRSDPGEAKLKGYILDLRNNPGGLLNQAVEITNAFVDGGEIVSTRGRDADNRQTYSARSGVNLSQGKPVVVLINGGSASASEIVSGALQDLKRATLIGSRSFGKGSVQTILPLGEEGALKLTTARYFTPSGRSIQAKGIEPDIPVAENIPDDLKGKVSSLGEASLVGHLKNGTEEAKGSDAYVPPDKTKDTQLQAAINLLHGAKPEALKTAPATVTSQ
ncbi:S41A family C-terminal processing peptidase-3 [Roseiarcus fermentans]|uniref:S41A family C-terminal processing peptidase-3 n=1 Tax=Roseiarcus fermentans TaxID=1473586 RepID=A0A366FPI7_9HYPH|nr:S41 family peptidase [Roseiarcus fermentans]RBP16562.1 S41A family C-terminal processing peptidase-3 [Roseiarcus fermentans]